MFRRLFRLLPALLACALTLAAHADAPRNPDRVWVAWLDGRTLEEVFSRHVVVLDRFPDALVLADEASAVALVAAGFRVESPVGLPAGVTVTLLRARSEATAAKELDASTFAAHGARIAWLGGRDAIVLSEGPLAEDEALVRHQRKALRSVPLRPAFAPAPAGRSVTATDFAPSIQSMADQISGATLVQVIGDLAGSRPVTVGSSPVTFATRSTPTSQCDLAEQYVYERFQAMGIADVQYDPYTFSATSARNVIATLPGVERPGQVVIIGGHLDSTSPSASTLAPGANDNASGIAGLLLTADILRQHSFRSTIRFVAFTGEEQGLYGSSHYANAAAARGDTIIGVVIYDMIAWHGALNQIDIEGQTAWLPVMNVMNDACARYTGLATNIVTTSWGSDHVPFQDVGYPAFLAIESEYETYPCYHQTCDSTGWNQPAFGADVARAGLATVAQLAGPLDLALSHTPLPPSENLAGPYAVAAAVTSVRPLAAGFPRLYWGYGASVTDSVSMTPAGAPNSFAANIPGPGFETDVRYYLRVNDDAGGTATAPATAPAAPYLFHVGPNTTPPVITHSGPGDFPTILWPATLSATITDDQGVDPASVLVSWALNAAPKPAFALARVGASDVYSGAFPSLPSDVAPGDVVTYHIEAADIAAVANTARYPASGEAIFTLSAALGTVLVLDDDEVAKRPETKLLADAKDPARWTTLTSAGDVGVLSANPIARWLNAAGYVATVQAANTSSPASWPGYSFIVSASGGNTSPVANAAYRAALEAYVAAGHKLLVEGGEVGYDAISSPGYPTFAASVLHGASWATDNAGPLLRLAAQATHPIANTPNVLPASIPITFVASDYGSEDSYAAVAPAYAVYGVTTQPGNVGIGVFDDNQAPQSAPVVVFAFDLKDVSDSTVARKLLENTAHFLTAPEPPPQSTLRGRVAVGTSWAGAGITVTANPGAHTTSTTGAGEFTLPNLYAGTYSVSADLAGYSGSPVMTSVGQAGEATIVLRLFGQASENHCANPALPIPDNNPTGVRSDMAVAGSFGVSSVEVSVNITHTYRGDLRVDLIHGATTVRLHNGTGGSAADLIGTYPTTLTPAGSLGAFAGQPAAGTWTLFVADAAASDVGTLQQWCLTLRGPADTTQTVGVESAQIPRSVEFGRVYPSPSPGGSVSMSFALPRSSPVRVTLYDVGGRLVRTVTDRVYDAGRTTLVWDGRDDRGAALRPGMYLARLTTPDGKLHRRFVVLK